MTDLMHWQQTIYKSSISFAVYGFFLKRPCKKHYVCGLRFVESFHSVVLRRSRVRSLISAMAEDNEEKPSALFMKIRPKWVDDNSVTHCKKCQLPFTFLRRKHHCRNCGEIFCGNCSNNMRQIPKLNYKYEVRVCDNCNALLAREEHL
jgi:hypothetical protein